MVSENSNTNSARRQTPVSSTFSELMKTDWAPQKPFGASRQGGADFLPPRHQALSALFPNRVLVIPAGELKTRSNDTDYRFRPHSAFTHLTALGQDFEPGAFLVFVPHPFNGHNITLFVPQPKGAESSDFYTNSRQGEFWVGPRPRKQDFALMTGLACKYLDNFSDFIKNSPLETPDQVEVLTLPDLDDTVAELLAATFSRPVADLTKSSAVLEEALSELRLIKDNYEIDQMRTAIAATKAGFDAVITALPHAREHARGERIIEATFDSLARINGNAVGYETIAASGEHATILHWIRNNGAVRNGDLLLLDAGVEIDSLYTADITRTLPVSGRFNEVQGWVYDAVLAAADADFAAAQPGAKFRDVHNAAMEVITTHLIAWGLISVSQQEALAATGGQHRRWMVHGTSHHLGLDVHDCAKARSELYVDGVLEPGMVFTIEPGLYFKSEDLSIPAEYRGIGVRIEDDVLITKSGNENLSAAFPRSRVAVEAWMQDLLGN